MTPAQLQALNTAINATPAWSAIPNNDDGHFALAALLNQAASPAFPVWRSEVPVESLIDGIDGAKYTPTDVPDATATFTNRLLAIQTKQMNLQNLIVGRATLNCSKTNVRAWLRDAVIQVPAGANGANVNPGGTNGGTVLALCTRSATSGEKVLAGAQETTGGVTANVLGYEGQISPSDVQQARSLG